MIGRCIKCNEFLVFDEKKKQQVLPSTRCPCGGGVEAMSGDGRLSGEHPTYPTKTFTDEEGKPYFYAYKNKAGQYFVSQGDKMQQVQNPIVLPKYVSK
jgi:hypothetical protein